MPDLFVKRGLRTVVLDALDMLGGRAARDELVAEVKGRLTLSEYEEWLEPAFRRAVVTAAKSRGSVEGAEAIYEIGGDVAPLRLFSVEEFTAKARSIAQLSKANKEMVYELSRICRKVHGSTFDADAILREVGAA